MMSLTLSDLVAIPELCTELVCGAERATVSVSWAHVCELQDPSEWLGVGDLLMTTGMGIPPGPEDQRRYIDRLDRGGVAGIVIGKNMHAPTDMSALLSRAAELSFPVLMTDYGIPFSALLKEIVGGFEKLESERLKVITRVYETARLNIQGLGLTALLGRLEKDVGADLYLVDAESFLPWAHELDSIPDVHLDVIKQGLRSGKATPVVQRFSSEGGELLLVDVPSNRACILVSYCSVPLDFVLLHHIVAVIATEVERIRIHRDAKLEKGVELIDDIFHQRIVPREIERRLIGLGASLHQLRVAVTKSDSSDVRRIESILARHGLELIYQVVEGGLSVLFWNDEVIRILHKNLPIRMGVSNVMSHVDEFPRSLREAQLALDHIEEDGALMFYSHVGNSAPWLPRNLNDASEAFQSILGALSEYDESQGARLLQTLREFLKNNRSWTQTAQKLHIHRQTLVYRIRRIEEITGRSLDTTEDVAALWFAVKSADMTSRIASV